MKLHFFCYLICFLFASTASALPVGNPSEINLFNSGASRCDGCTSIFCFSDNYNCLNFAVGFYGDYVFNRHMKTVTHKDVDTTRLFTNAGYLAVSLFDRMEFFTALGVTRLSLNTSLGAFNQIDPHPLFEVESQTAFSYNLGAHLLLLRYQCLTCGLEGQYFSTEPNIKRLYIAAGAVSYPGDQLITRYHEWQLAATVAYHYNDFFVPYAGLKYASSFWKLNNGRRFIIESNTNTFLHNLKNEKNVGYAIGLTLCPLGPKKIAATVEARFSDEKALYVNGQMRF
jgi:major outer membrane protein